MSHSGSSARKNSAKRWGTALGLTAAMLPVMVLPPAEAATAPPLTPPGVAANVLVISPAARTRVNDWLSGGLCHAGNTCRDVEYLSVSVPDGVRALDASIAATSDTKVVFAYSGGAAVVSNWLAQHGDTVVPNLSFVLIGNPTRKYGGSAVGPVSVMPVTGYQVIDITREYDSVSDLPDNPFNFLAEANAFAGFRYIHLDYSTVNVYDTANTVWTEGNTTYVFVPTPNLPLLEPLRRLGLGALADQLNAPLKAIVDKAYDRPYLTTTPAPTVPPTPTQTAQLATTSTIQAAPIAPTTFTPSEGAVAAKVAPVVNETSTSTPATPTTRSSLRFWPHRKGSKPGSSTTPSTAPTSTTDGNKAEPGGVTSSAGTGTDSGSNSTEGSTPDSSTGGDGSE